MKAVLTCDDVFDVLTRAPFPSGGVDDETVESHLAVCHECRQLAEAFRPAVGLFHESLSAGFGSELPIYRGRLQAIVEASPRMSHLPQPQDDCPRSEQQSSTSSIRRLLAIAASLALVGSVIIATFAATSRRGVSMPATSTVRAVEDRDDSLLMRLEIPSNCRSMPGSLNREFVAEYVCCTKCHHATNRMASTHLAIRKSSAACTVCHDRILSDAVSMVVPCKQVCDTLLACAPIRNL